MICSVVLTAGTRAGVARRWPSPAGFSGAAVPQPGPTQLARAKHGEKTAKKLPSRRHPRIFVGNEHDAKTILPNRREP